MADAQGGKLFGWMKAAFTGMFGLVSGAVLVYFTPLVDRVIKPGKPVANFKFESDGLKVVFHNRSTGGGDGWWDFGDGSALEPFMSNEDTATHTYPKPGIYTAKLSLRNLLGEENERAVTVNVESPNASGPVVEAFDVVAIRPDVYAPATFRVVTKVKGAELCVLNMGEEYPAELVSDTNGQQERLVTFKHPGTHFVKLVAVAGRQHVEKKLPVRVEKQPPGVAMAVLNVTEHAAHVQTLRQEHGVAVKYPHPAKDDKPYKFSQGIVASEGYDITDAKFVQPAQGQYVRNVKLEVTKDRKKAVVSGELLRGSGIQGWANRVLVTQEMKTPTVVHAPKQVAATLALPGTTVLPLPADQCGWKCSRRQYKLELREGENAVWEVTQLPIRGEVVLRNQRYVVEATEKGGQVQLSATTVAKGFIPTGGN